MGEDWPHKVFLISREGSRGFPDIDPEGLDRIVDAVQYVRRVTEAVGDILLRQSREVIHDLLAAHSARHITQHIPDTQPSVPHTRSSESLAFADFDSFHVGYRNPGRDYEENLAMGIYCPHKVFLIREKA